MAADMVVVLAAAIPLAAVVPMEGGGTKVGVVMAAPTMAAADIMADATTTPRAIMAAASVLVSMPRPAMDTPRRSATHRAFMTKAAIGITILVAPQRPTAIECETIPCLFGDSPHIVFAGECRGLRGELHQDSRVSSLRAEYQSY